MTDDADFTLAAAGDAILTRRLAALDEPRLDATVGRLRDADATVANLEVLPIEEDAGTPAADSGGTYMRAPPWVLDELAWAGVDLFPAATNHVGDYGHDGMRAAMAELEARELAYAGLGRTLARARQPAYVDTPGGRVALVAACTTITPGSTAGEQRPDLQGRPGLAPLRLETSYVVPEDAHERVRALSESLGLEGVKARRESLGFPVPGEDDDGFTLLNVGGEHHLEFEVGEAYAVRRRVNGKDRKALVDQVHAASRQADWVVVSLHSHEGRDGRRNDDSVPAFLESIARTCVDAGADAFVGHGPHVLRGVEVYEGAPVFYSLGNFAMQNETVGRLPADIYERYDLDPHASEPADLYDARVYEGSEEDEGRVDDGGNEDDEGSEGDAGGEGSEGDAGGEGSEGDAGGGGSAGGDVDDPGAEPGRDRIGFLADDAFWESVLPVCRFDDGGLRAVELHPLDLEGERPRPRRGWPLAAEGDRGERILADLAALSEPYSTSIEVERDGSAVRGVVRVER